MIKGEKKYEIIDVADHLSFHEHINILDDCIGQHGNLILAVQEINEKCRVFMPKVFTDRNGNPKLTSSGYTNEFNSSYTTLTMTRPETAEYKPPLPDDYITLMFAKLDSKGEYSFLGAFVDDSTECIGRKSVSKRIATRVKLIGDPVYRIELLDEDRSCLGSSYIIEKPDSESYGTFDSWLIKNNNLAAKETDKSFFEYSSSGIPKGIRWFFEAENLTSDEHLSIILRYESIEYKAYIEKQEMGRTRIRWHSDLCTIFNNYFENIDNFPILTFSRCGKNKYDISFLQGGKQKFISALAETCSIEEKTEHANGLDDFSLKNIAQTRSRNTPPEHEVTIMQKERDPYIAEYTKRKAKGICQLCGMAAPFKDAKGRPYLESHHIIWLSKGGEDSIDNTVALCPNCHRKMHVLNNEQDINYLLNIKLD